MLRRLINPSIFLMFLLGLALFASGVAVAQQGPQDPGNDPDGNPPPNEAPKVITTIPDLNLTVGGTSGTINLGTYFTDPENETLTYGAGSSDTSIATVSISTNSLSITAKAAGTATITVIATDPGDLTAEQQFSVTVTAPNNAPTAVGTIPDQTLTENGTAATVDVSGYFSDADGDTLTYTAALLENSTIATVSVSSATVTIEPVTTGEATISVTATDPDGANATQKISITVNSANAAPTAVGTIPDQTVKLGGTALTLEVDKYFQDTDGDVLTFTATSADSAKATVSVSDSVVITITPVAEGSTTITVTATDPGNLSAKQQFSVTVKPQNRTPVAVGSMSDSTVMIGGSGDEKNVRLYFSDADNDTLTYTATSSDTAKATVTVEEVAEDVTMLYATPVAAGTATITVTATDTEGASATQSYTLTVIPENNSPTPKPNINKLPDQSIKVGGTATVDLASYFTDADGDTLTYTATSADESKATVSVSSATLTITAVAEGSTTVTARATDPGGLWSKLDGAVTVRATNSAPTAITIPDQTVNANQTGQVNLASYFSDPDGDALTYTASSSDTAKATTSLSGTTLTVQAIAVGTPTISATATDPFGSSASLSFTLTINAAPGTADVTPGLSSEELSLLGALLTYNTLIFNELHNGSDNASDWLELRNVSNIDISIDNWQLTIQTGSDTAIIPFPAGTVIPAGEVLLLTNTEMAAASTVVVESFALPQSDFALILRSPIAFGDIAGNYFQTGKERPETAPALTADTVWERVQATTSGYRAEAWAESTHRNGQGSPGYQPSALVGDLNNDGVVDILDLVLVASQFGTTGITAADINGDGTVNIQDLVLVANALDNAAAAPSAKQSTAALVNTWLQLAQQNTPDAVTTSLPEGFSYARGIQVLEQLARALTPETTALFANYPNPFNPETWIPYQLAKPADVTVTIYASDGNVVRTLALGHQAAGMYKHRSQAAYWDGKNELGESVASGLYFYTLTAGEFTATRKMLILK